MGERAGAWAGAAHADQLHEWVMRLCSVAPGFKDTILRALGIAGGVHRELAYYVADAPPDGIRRLAIHDGHVSIAFGDDPPAEADLSARYGRGRPIPRIHFDSPPKLFYEVTVPGGRSRCQLSATLDGSLVREAGIVLNPATGARWCFVMPGGHLLVEWARLPCHGVTKPDGVPLEECVDFYELAHDGFDAEGTVVTTWRRYSESEDDSLYNVYHCIEDDALVSYLTNDHYGRPDGGAAFTRTVTRTVHATGLDSPPRRPPSLTSVTRAVEQYQQRLHEAIAAPQRELARQLERFERSLPALADSEHIELHWTYAPDNRDVAVSTSGGEVIWREPYAGRGKELCNPMREIAAKRYGAALDDFYTDVDGDDLLLFAGFD